MPFLKRRIYFFTFSLSLSIIFLASCSKKEDTMNPTYATLYSEVFSKRCVECHRPGGQAYQNSANLDFSTSSTGYNSMVGVSVSGITTIAGGCTGRKIVQASQPTNSYILGTFFSDYGLGGSTFGGAGCSPYNHTGFANSVPTSREKTALVEWISKGALNN